MIALEHIVEVSTTKTGSHNLRLTKSCISDCISNFFTGKSILRVRYDLFKKRFVKTNVLNTNLNLFFVIID